MQAEQLLVQVPKSPCQAKNSFQTSASGFLSFQSQYFITRLLLLQTSSSEQEFWMLGISSLVIALSVSN